MKTDEKDIKAKLRNLKESIEDFLENTELDEVEKDLKKRPEPKKGEKEGE